GLHPNKCVSASPLQHKTQRNLTHRGSISRVKLLRSAYKYDAVVVFLQCRAQMALPGRFHQTPMQEMQVSPMGMAERHRLHMVVGRKAPLKIELLGVVSRA